MMPLLFFILLLAGLLVMSGFRRGAISLFVLDIVLAAFLTVHHMDETLNIIL